MVRSITATFSAPFSTVDVGAFVLNKSGAGAIPMTVSFNGAGTVATLTFPTASLDDGYYTLTFVAGYLHDASGGTLDGDNNGISGGNYALFFHRLFGDSDGNAFIDQSDFIAFRSAFNTADSIFDFGGDGIVNQNDFIDFRSRFGTSPPT